MTKDCDLRDEWVFKCSLCDYDGKTVPYERGDVEVTKVTGI